MNKKFKKLLLASLLIAVSSQFYIDILFSDFRVTCAVIALGLTFYFYRDLHPILLGITASITTFTWRTSILILTHGYDHDIIRGYIPEIYFYVFIGFFFWLLSNKDDFSNINRFFIIIAICDFTSNVFEVLIRIFYFNYTFYFDILTSLLIVAIIRSGAVWLCVNGTRYYQMLIMNEEHEKRYRRLVWLTLKLKSEIYWMKKNMDKIEETMTHSYNLFDSIRNNIDPDSWADRSVQVASDVHEIKKEYELVMRGVEEITEFKFQGNGMYLKDIVNLLQEKMRDEIRRKNYDVDLNFHIDNDFFTDKHYQLMSIFRNLISNSLDAISHMSNNTQINFVHENRSDFHNFIISDTGCGISEEDLEFIFSPGFSTKINYTTGQVNRGLGLSLVKEIIENEFGGELTVESVLDSGTEFKISIPKNKLEVQ